MICWLGSTRAGQPSPFPLLPSGLSSSGSCRLAFLLIEESSSSLRSHILHTGLAEPRCAIWPLGSMRRFPRAPSRRPAVLPSISPQGTWRRFFFSHGSCPISLAIPTSCVCRASAVQLLEERLTCWLPL